MKILEHPQPPYDVVVVGARCAGAATAMLLARAGKRVLVLERGRPGRDTLSTHGLMTGAVVQLHRWNLLERLEAAGTPRIDKATFHYAEEPLELDIAPRFGIQGLYGPRRMVLDGLLLDAAVEAGAHVMFGARVDALVRHGERVAGVQFRGPDGTFHEVESDLVVGADGRNSTIAELVGALPMHLAPHSTACLYTYVGGLENTGYHWYYGTQAHAGLIPTNDGAHCVFVLVPPENLPPLGRRDPGVRFRTLAEQANLGLAELLNRASRVEAYRTFTGQPGFVRRAFGPGWALVGDAGYFKDPCTAHGITDALRDAELLAVAILEDSPEAMQRYQQTRDDLSLPLFELTDQIAAIPADLGQLRELHMALSREMRREASFLAELDGSSLAA